MACAIGQTLYHLLRHQQPSDDLLPFILQNSSAITEFNDKTGVGFDSDGSRYVVLGKPSDPTGMIRFSVSQMMKAQDIHWKYAFID